jgi:hypothetical protein
VPQPRRVGANRGGAAVAVQVAATLLLGGSTARAHGSPPAVQGPVAMQEGAPWLVRLNEGHAIADGAGFRFVCPAAFGRELPPLAIQDAEQVYVVGAEDLYVLQPSGVVRDTAQAELSAASVVALARLADHAYALRLRFLPESSELVRLDPTDSVVIWRDTRSWVSMVAHGDGLIVARVEADRLSWQRVGVDGTAQPLGTAVLPALQPVVHLRSAGGLLFAFVIAERYSLWRLEAAGASQLFESEAPIEGPVALGSGELRIASHGEARRLTGDTTEPTAAELELTCLESLQGQPFGCASEVLWDLQSEREAFSLERLAPPLPHGPNAARCEAQWLRYRPDLINRGLMPADSSAGDAGNDASTPASEPPPAAGCDCQASTARSAGGLGALFWLPWLWCALRLSARSRLRAGSGTRRS